MNQSLPYVDDAATPSNGVEIGTTKDVPAKDTAATSFSAMSEKVLSDKRRTPGLKLFDFLLYPVFTNIGVFGISVAATYLTTRGGDRDAAGKLIYGKTGEFFQKRGEWMIDKFKSMGLTHSQADMGKMVFFSFLDGSLLAPFVKMLEDRRERIAMKIDETLGTKPDDVSIYTAEPKQTWLSVLGGRFATAAIVVPTAVALDKTGLNDKLFNKPGEQVGAWLSKKPGVKKFFGKLDVKELSRIAFFEAFYTSVCTGGLYFSSRFLARRTGNKDEVKPAAESVVQAQQPVVTSPEIPMQEDEKSVSFREQVQVKPKTVEPRKTPRAVRTTFDTHREKYLEDRSHQAAVLAV